MMTLLMMSMMSGDVNDDDDVNGTHSALLADDANAVSQVFTRVASHIMPELC